MSQMRSKMLCVLCVCVVAFLSGCAHSTGVDAVENHGGGQVSGGSEAAQSSGAETWPQDDYPLWGSMSEMTTVSHAVVVATFESSSQKVYDGIPVFVDGKRAVQKVGWNSLEILSRMRVDRVLKGGGDFQPGDIITVSQITGADSAENPGPEDDEIDHVVDLSQGSLVLFLDEAIRYEDEDGMHEDFSLESSFQGVWTLRGDEVVAGAGVDAVAASVEVPLQSEPGPDAPPVAGEDPAQAWAAEYAKNWPSTLDQLEQMVAEAPQSL